MSRKPVRVSRVFVAPKVPGWLIDRREVRGRFVLCVECQQDSEGGERLYAANLGAHWDAIHTPLGFYDEGEGEGAA